MGKMFAANVALSAALLAACAQPNTPVPPPAPPKPAFGYHDVLPQAQQHLSERARTYIRTAEAMARKAAQREAEAAYRIVLSDPRLTPYERATIWQSLAYQQAERSNYRGAIESFLASLDESDPDRGVGLPLEKIAATLHNIGQLYMVIEDYEKAVIILEGRRRFTVNVTPPQEALLATAYFQLGRHDDALASIRSAIAGAGRDSPENWRQLELAIYLETERFREALTAAEALLARWPNRKTYCVLRTALLHELKIPHHAAAEIAKCDTTLRPRPRPDDAPPVRPRAKPGSDDIQRFPQTQDGAIPS